MEKRYRWRLKQRELLLGERTLVMGILNVTPDSFSDGGEYADPDRAFARAVELEDQGADIIDIGAESTKPGSERISEAEELRRLVPVLKRLRNNLRVPVSVDTYKSAVAEKALEHGAEIINDPSGVLFDLQLPKVVTKYDAGLIINHMRGRPETWAKLPPMKELMRSITIDLEAAIHRATQGRVNQHQIVLDPGLGFGKRREQNAEIIAQLGMLKRFDLPIAIGPSRKSFLKSAKGTAGRQQITKQHTGPSGGALDTVPVLRESFNKEQELDTEFATASAVAACIINGAHIVRVHDVKAMKTVVEVADSIRHATLYEPDEPPVQTRWQRGQ